jgi:hypothetical protein
VLDARGLAVIITVVILGIAVQSWRTIAVHEQRRARRRPVRR